ncbi:MAG: polysaccharide biosynthesis/export family protein [Cyclobacteriaceae bacterium]
MNNTYILRGNRQKLTPFFIFLLGVILTASCVPNRKIVYLQTEDDLKKENTTDVVVRSYDSKVTNYILKPNDIISLRVASITPDEYNFIKKYEEQLGQIRKLNQYQQNAAMSGQNNRLMNQGGFFQQRGGQEGGGMSPLLLDQMQSGFVLDDQGQLELPEIGTVTLSGLTMEQAEDSIRAKLLGYFETPMVRIQLLNFHFTILGEVEVEGRYTAFDPKFNMFDAFMLAGNLTEFADRSNIKIVRTNGDKKEIIYLNTLDENLLAAEYFYLQPNDLIVVPPLTVRTTRNYTLPSTSTIISIVTAAISLYVILSR